MLADGRWSFTITALGPNSLIFFFLINWLALIFCLIHVSDVKQRSDRHHEHSDEHTANKCACIVHQHSKEPFYRPYAIPNVKRIVDGSPDTTPPF